MKRTQSQGVVLLTNIPTPYRNPVYERLPQDIFTVLFCAPSESNRFWNIGDLRFRHRFLESSTRALGDGFNFIHDSPQIARVLNELNPAVLITTGFNPAHLRAFAWAQWHGIPHIAMTDGTLHSVSTLTWRHVAIRRLVFAKTRAFIAAAKAGIELYRSYGISEQHIFRSHLCADNSRFAKANLPNEQRDIDALFVGQLHPRKMPLFFAELCALLVNLKGSIRVAVLGKGPEEASLTAALDRPGIDFLPPGFVQPEHIPAWFGRSRLLMFPTQLDPWGVVANEALAAGTPVFTTAQAGVAGDLVIDGINGRILPADAALWAREALALLRDPKRWEAMSAAAATSVNPFNFDAAANGIVMACEHVSPGVMDKTA